MLFYERISAERREEEEEEIRVTEQEEADPPKYKVELSKDLADVSIHIL